MFHLKSKRHQSFGKNVVGEHTPLYIQNPGGFVYPAGARKEGFTPLTPFKIAGVWGYNPISVEH